MVLIANMQMERRKVGDYYSNHQSDRGLLIESTPPSKWYSNNSSPLVLQPCSFSSGGSRSSVGGCGNGGGGCIEHPVSKFDTLAGVAIKYGVEVADIKRMNGLTTDLQMFALKSLQIPLPGRHPPSPIMSNGPTSSEATRVVDRNSITLLKLSSSSQRGYYGLNKRNDENGPKPFVGTHRKSRSCLVNSLSEKGEVQNEDKEAGSDNKSFDKLVRRRKSDIDLHNPGPETLVKQQGNTNNSMKGLQSLLFPLRLIPEALSGVRKSSSTPTLQDSTNNNTTSIWPTSVLSLTADLQALSTAAMPILDALPNPIGARKNKAALD